MATSITLSVWSFWRLGEAWFLLRCFPFSKTTISMFVTAVVLGLTLKLSLEEQTIIWRVLITGSSVTTFLIASWYLGKQEEDDQLLKAVQRKLNRLRNKEQQL